MTEPVTPDRTSMLVFVPFGQLVMRSGQRHRDGMRRFATSCIRVRQGEQGHTWLPAAAAN